MKSPAFTSRRSFLPAFALASGLALASLLGSRISAAEGRAALSESGFVLPSGSPTRFERLIFLAVDERSLPIRDNLALFLSKPEVIRAPVLAPATSPTAPDNSAAHFNGTVIYEDGRYRMWYYAIGYVSGTARGKSGEFGISPVCYAESSDGINWTRPNLRQVEWRGTWDNNCLAIGPEPILGSNCCSVIRDDEDPRPERRYKMAFGFQDKARNMSRAGTAVSPDGIHWTRLPADASGPNFAEIGSLYKHGGKYYLNSQIRGWGEGDRPEGRQAYVWISTDFETWLPEPAASFKVPEPIASSGYGTHGLPPANYTQVHLGVGATSLGNVAIGLWGMWNNRIPNWGEGGIDCHLGLVVSEDGIHFDEVAKGIPYIRSDESPADPVPGKNYPTILHQSNSMFNVGNQTLIFHGRWRNVDFQKLKGAVRMQHLAENYWGAVALARLPRDRWGALALAGANPWSGVKTAGAVWTRALTLPASAVSRLTLNASDLAGLRIEVADDNFRSIQGFSDGRASGASDQFDAEIKWGSASLADLAGRTVRFRVHFKRSEGTYPRLYALNLSTK
ncbi:MAG: hypothetical protein FJ382_08910 [Verrucomicrobia bacterium]|nr:hypothetical protein [Verrucomicrobiota bacterium]